jgi:ribosome-interacting GTPase 1
MDVSGAQEKADRFCQHLPQCEVIRISAAAGLGLDRLKNEMLERLNRTDDQP